MRKVEYVISSHSNDIIVSKWFNVYHMTLAIRVGNMPAITIFLRTFDHHNLWKKAEFNQWLRCAIDEAVRNPAKINIMDMILEKCPFRLSLVQLRSACRTWPESNVHVIRRVLRELPHAIHGATVGTNALFIAINSGSVASVKAVLGFTGTNVNITRSVYRRSGYQIITPLEAALQSKRRDVVKYLLSHGASLPAWSKWPLQEQMYDILRVEFLKRMGGRKMLTYQEFRSLSSEQRSRLIAYRG
ncbi:hypothetical protein J1614_012263 [Plenodomus biglobosus]|nr:hypothetical protein J1614_012263 [Plenodomus biglobosus]